MLDIKLFREENSFKKIIESEKKRFKSTEFAQNTKKYDFLWRKAKQDLESLKKEKNIITKKISENKNLAKELAKKIKEIKEKIKDLEKKEKEYFIKREENRYKVGNILFDDVPIGKDEESNVTIKFHGKAKVQEKDIEYFIKESKSKNYEILSFKPKSHADLGIERDLFDLERAARISGARFYFLKKDLALMHLAVLRLAIDKLIAKGFIFMTTPFFLKKEIMQKAAELNDFEETLYATKEHFLIATAEQSLASYHYNEIIDESELPLKYAGLSSCFRREAGSHGKDTRGIFRVHQFDKVEQYIYCKEEDNEKMHREIVANAEEILQDLELPYRIINICSGDMNDTAAKKYDIESWMPVQGRFREMVSASITTDYQTRKLNARYFEKGERKFMHSLNGTAVASPRILAAIIENHQKEDGYIKVPKALQKYLGKKEI